jgi:hypothetical protein
LLRKRILACRRLESAALVETARRVWTTPEHAREAADTGRRVDRALVRLFAAGAGAARALGGAAGSGRFRLELADLPGRATRGALAVAARHWTTPAQRRSATCCPDDRRTVVFTTRRATLAWLRERLADARNRLVARDEAGIGRGAYVACFSARLVPLGCHDRPRRSGLAPRHLLTTDVAAEGVDLGRAERVVHYDLPWTDARMAQREGRISVGPC